MVVPSESGYHWNCFIMMSTLKNLVSTSYKHSIMIWTWSSLPVPHVEKTKKQKTKKNILQPLQPLPSTYCIIVGQVTILEVVVDAPYSSKLKPSIIYDHLTDNMIYLEHIVQSHFNMCLSSVCSWIQTLPYTTYI